MRHRRWKARKRAPALVSYLSGENCGRHRLRTIARVSVIVTALAALSTPTAGAAQSFVLAWDSSVGATGYTVLYGFASGQYIGSIDVGNTTTMRFTAPTVNQTYYFAVKAYNAFGQSGPSTEIGAWVGTVWRTPSQLRTADFDGDGKTDIAVYRGTTGEWFARKSLGGGLAYASWGAPALGDVPVPGDYDGDRMADFAVYRTSTGEWFLNQSRDGAVRVYWGSPAYRDVPVPADYDGDGKLDIAIYRRSTGEWFIRQSSNLLLRRVQWGAAGDDDLPVPGDYDGNHKTDIAVYRQSTGQWFVLFDNSTSTVWAWGARVYGDIPVPADYDGDGKTDIGIFRLLTGEWIVRLSSTNGPRTVYWGAPNLGDVPVPADYDGDGKADFAVFRAPTAGWYIAYSAGGTSLSSWGSPALGDSVGGFHENGVITIK